MNLNMHPKTYLVQSRADVRPYHKLDALDLSLDEHDPEVLFL